MPAYNNVLRRTHQPTSQYTTPRNTTTRKISEYISSHLQDHKTPPITVQNVDTQVSEKIQQATSVAIHNAGAEVQEKIKYEPATRISRESPESERCIQALDSNHGIAKHAQQRPVHRPDIKAWFCGAKSRTPQHAYFRGTDTQPTTTLQNWPNIDRYAHNQGYHSTPATEDADPQPPAITQDPLAYKPALFSSPELETTPFSTSEINLLTPIVQTLVDRGRLNSGKISKCGSAVAVIESISHRTSLIKEGIQEVITDCEAKSKDKQEGCLQISSHISKEILGIVCALEAQQYKTLLELRKVPMILLDIVAETYESVEILAETYESSEIVAEPCESLEKVCEGDDLLVMEIEEMLEEYRAVINQFRYLSERTFRFFQREIRLYCWLMEKALDHRDFDEEIV